MVHRKRVRTNPNKVAEAAQLASGILTEAGVRHLLCGGIAVAAHGYERATSDVDFLVGDEAFVSRGIIVMVRPEIPHAINGVSIDLVTAPHMQEAIEYELNTNTTGIVSAPFLVLMKLDVYRPRDRNDVTELLRADGGLADEVRAAYQLPALLKQRLAVCERESLE